MYINFDTARTWSGGDVRIDHRISTSRRHLGYASVYCHIDVRGCVKSDAVRDGASRRIQSDHLTGVVEFGNRTVHVRYVNISAHVDCNIQRSTEAAVRCKKRVRRGGSVSENRICTRARCDENVSGRRIDCESIED